MTAIVKEGWLTKEGAVRKSWRRRWFILYDSRILSYYTNERLLSSPKGNIDISTATAIVPRYLTGSGSWPSSSTEERSFGIVTPSRTFRVFADTESESREWKKTLEEMIDAIDGDSDSSRDA
jgi:hypothetical protein